MHLSECKNNYLCYCREVLAEMMADFEKMAGDDYHALFEQRRQGFKGELLIQQGVHKDEFYFIESGWARTYFINEQGNEETLNFFFPYLFVESLVSFNDKIPSEFNIVLMEDAELRVINRSLLFDMKKRYTILMEMQEKVILSYTRWYFEGEKKKRLLKRTKDFHQYIIQQHPHYMHKILDKYMASYIGIQKESYSRLRSNKKN